MFKTIQIKEVKMQLGQLIKTARKARGLSQTDLAKSLGLSRTTIQNLEKGNNFTADTFLLAVRELDLLDNLYREVVNYNKIYSNVKPLY